MMEAVRFPTDKDLPRARIAFLRLKMRSPTLALSKSSEPCANPSLPTPPADSSRSCEVCLLLLFWYVLAQWSLSAQAQSANVHANPSPTWRVLSTDCPLATLLCGTKVAHSTPDLKPTILFTVTTHLPCGT